MSLPLPTSRDTLLEAVVLLVDALNRGLPAPVYTLATRPAATAVTPGTMIFVSDGGAGAVFQGSTGAAWVNLG